MKSGRNIPDREIRRWIAEKDTRGRGNVNFSDFCKSYAKIISKQGPSRHIKTSDRSSPDRQTVESKSERIDSAGENITELAEKVKTGNAARRELLRVENEAIKHRFAGNEELLVRARAAFDRFDAGSSGHINSAELANVLQVLGYNTPSLLRDARAWIETWRISHLDSAKLGFRDFADAFSEICGGMLRAHKHLDRLAERTERARLRARREEEERHRESDRRRRTRSYSTDSDSDSRYSSHRGRRRPRNQRRRRSNSRDRRSDDEQSNYSSDSDRGTSVSTRPVRPPPRGGRRYY